eukprot:scaffold114397_cov28-Tisochrysis_lutea.AAC.2
MIERFVEHGRKFAGNLINAGVYIFSPSIFHRLRVVKSISMEKEVLPKLVRADPVRAQQHTIPLACRLPRPQP